MMLQRIKRRIENLRQQPEPVRLRAVSLLTAVSGGMLVILWVTVLLPLQLKFGRGGSNEEVVSQAVASPQSSPTSLLAEPQRVPQEDVAGVRDTSRPVTLPSSVPVDPSPSPTPTATLIPVQP